MFVFLEIEVVVLGAVEVVLGAVLDKLNVSFIPHLFKPKPYLF